LFPSSHSVLTDLFRIAFRTFHYIFFLITTLSFCNSSPIYATPDWLTVCGYLGVTLFVMWRIFTAD
jgi:hypothetical protein